MKENKLTVNDIGNIIYKCDIEDSYKVMNTRAEGLTTFEVLNNQKKYGKNVITKKKKNQ